VAGTGDAGAPPLDCGALGQVRSTGGGERRPVALTNATAETRGVVWIGGDGAPVDLGTLGPGLTGQIDTVPGDVWMFTDGPGNCVELVRTGAREEIVLTLPSAGGDD
ncbi:hypothetical protein HKCCE2091_21930, partial [Rhodobacterales bacterium HKCCE2091]|nr:hypothetical protein [Rhodobacterales bacterium HKCCE2091]